LPGCIELDPLGIPSQCWVINVAMVVQNCLTILIRQGEDKSALKLLQQCLTNLGCGS
jgi:hypothetical protein